jgi:hypothetical protein
MSPELGPSADMAKEHRDVRSWVINGPSSDASQGPLAIHLRTELSRQQLQFLDVIRTCNRAVTIFMIIGSSQSKQYKPLILLWWARQDSNLQPDRYERWKLAVLLLEVPIFIEF